MADLEDFFAKRDKKKSKKKFDTSDDVAKVLEQRTKQKKELETGKSNYLAEGRQSPGPGLPIGGDDEWIEAEEKKPDFSNLKIQELVLTSDDEDDPSQEGKGNEDGSADGPWKKKQSKDKDDEKEKETPDNEPAEVKEVKEESEEVKPEGEDGDADESSKEKEVKEESNEPKRYVPPSMRNKPQEAAGSASRAPAAAPSIPFGSAMGGAYVPPSRRGTAAEGPTLAPMKLKKGAPTLGDQESFPSLS